MGRQEDQGPSSGACQHLEVGEGEAWAKGLGRAVKVVAGRPEGCGAWSSRKESVSCGHAVVRELGVRALADVRDP